VEPLDEHREPLASQVEPLAEHRAPLASQVEPLVPKLATGGTYAHTPCDM